MNRCHEPGDAQLIVSFLNGDGRAFDRLTSRYKNRLYVKILELMKDRQLAEDLLQDTYIRIIHSLRAGRYQDDGRFGLWALRIAHNLCIDYKRKASRRVALVLSDHAHDDSFAGLCEESAEQQFIRLQSQQAIQQLLNSLPSAQRQVVFYRHFEQLSFKEIALLTNASLNTTLGRMRYGIQNLRKLIREKDCGF